TIQRYVNFHFSVTMDLFGSDLSSNAATFYATGLKGRFQEERISDDHVLKDHSYPVLEPKDGQLMARDAPALVALNEKLRDDFVTDSRTGVARWNRALKASAIDFEFRVPHKAFHRQIGPVAGIRVSPEGKILREAEWNARVGDWLPSARDREFVQSLMGRVVEPGKFANWIAPPSIGINKQPRD